MKLIRLSRTKYVNSSHILSVKLDEYATASSHFVYVWLSKEARGERFREEFGWFPGGLTSSEDALERALNYIDDIVKQVNDANQTLNVEINGDIHHQGATEPAVTIGNIKETGRQK